MSYEIRREPHAGHYRNGGGHDLEWIDATGYAWHADVPDLPKGFEYHSGTLRDGVQHWYFVRIAPLSPGTCCRCS